MKHIIKAVWDWSHSDWGDSIIGGALYCAAIIVMWWLCEIIVCVVY
jgi:hypothetical protein